MHSTSFRGISFSDFFNCILAKASILVISSIFNQNFMNHNKNKNEGVYMISYEPLWETMRQKGISTYALINRFGIPASTVHTLKHNNNITMYTLEKLCNALNCTADSVVRFENDDNQRRE